MGAGPGLQYAQLTSYKTNSQQQPLALDWRDRNVERVRHVVLPVTGVVALSLSGDNAGSYVKAAVFGVIALSS